ncbi:S8 family serine peptidase [Peribacillus frigoritolerans]|nr:S8 family serine peptidase [Peribacillus frigoritolerans]
MDFKPEITAPGGQIYSTLNNDEYGMMSGTSMAAPHVSGGSALVLERVDKDFKLEGSDRANLAKNLMMNTSKPLTDQGVVNKALDWKKPLLASQAGSRGHAAAIRIVHTCCRDRGIHEKNRRLP